MLERSYGLCPSSLPAVWDRQPEAGVCVRVTWEGADAGAPLAIPSQFWRRLWPEPSWLGPSCRRKGSGLLHGTLGGEIHVLEVST